jgi:hypothetical protein
MRKPPATRMPAAAARTEFVNSHCSLAKKRLAFRSEESVYAVVGGRRSRRRTLRPGDRADPGLASVRAGIGSALRDTEGSKMSLKHKKSGALFQFTLPIKSAMGSSL